MVALGRIDEAKERLAANKNPSVRQLVSVGERAKANQVMSELENSNNPRSGTMAQGYAALGDVEQAFDWLEKAIDERVFLGVSPRLNPVFSEMREDPRWQRVMQKLVKLEVDVND